MHYESSIINTYHYTLDIDLRDDFEDIIYNKLIKDGYTDVDKEHAVFYYFNLQKRKIAPHPRTVFYSKEFRCPQDYELALKEFENKIITGADLTPYQSEKIKEASYNDMLLNDWGIQHFHLTRWIRDDGFAARSEHQIFAYVTDDSFYMIQVFPHKDDDIYYRKELVQILKNNWPELLEKHHIKGITKLLEEVDDQQYREIRDANALTFVELGENEIYGLIGGGYATNGMSNVVVDQAYFWMRRMTAFQDVIVNNAEWVARTIEQVGGELCSSMNIKLLWVDNADLITTCETNSGMVVQVDTKEGHIRVCRMHEVFG